MTILFHLYSVKTTAFLTHFNIPPATHLRFFTLFITGFVRPSAISSFYPDHLLFDNKSIPSSTPLMAYPFQLSYPVQAPNQPKGITFLTTYPLGHLFRTTHLLRLLLYYVLIANLVIDFVQEPAISTFHPVYFFFDNRYFTDKNSLSAHLGHQFDTFYSLISFIRFVFLVILFIKSSSASLTTRSPQTYF